MITGRHSSHINHCNILVRYGSPSVHEYIPPASQGAIPKESKSTSPDSTLYTCSNGIHTEAVVRIAYSKFFSPDNQRGALLELKAISAHGLAPLFQNYPPGLSPGLHEPTGLVRLSKSAKSPPSPLRDTVGHRPDQPNQRRPSPKKRPGTSNRQQAGQTPELHLILPTVGQTPEPCLTLRRPGGMHRQPPPPPAKTTGEYSSETAGPNFRATAPVLETDKHSTRAKTNWSIHFSETTVCTHTTVGIWFCTLVILLASELRPAGSSSDADDT